jgi:hypothetical protein
VARRATSTGVDTSTAMLDVCPMRTREIRARSPGDRQQIHGLPLFARGDAPPARLEDHDSRVPARGSRSSVDGVG